jgi:hypothetical protein
MRSSPSLRIAAGWRLLGVAWALLAGGCAVLPGAISPALPAAARRNDALAVYDALEALIEAGQDTHADRAFAYEEVKRIDGDTPAANFARAAVTGRLVQQRALRGAHMVGEVERYARRSREQDPDFRAGAATRLLGTLYVVAPSTLLQHGDSETGLELLEELVTEHPEVLENHLRLAEAYVSLNDPEPATDHLCQCAGRRFQLRRDERALLDELLERARPYCDSALEDDEAPIGTAAELPASP